MKKKIFYLSLGLMILAMAGCMKKDGQLAVQDVSTGPDAISTLTLKSASLTKKYIVVLKDDANISDDADDDARKSKVKGKGHDLVTKHTSKDEIEDTYETALQGFTVKLTDDQAKTMSIDPEVKYVEEDQIITLAKNEAKKSSPGGTKFTDYVPWGVARVGGGENKYRGDNDAWIIDTGIDLTHPDLNVGIKDAMSFVPGETPNDVRGHGTFIAGIIGAIAGNGGILGVAPGVKVIPVKIFAADGTAYLDAVIAAINYVAKKAKSGDVANLSLSLNTTSDALDEAIKNASSGKRKTIDFTIAAGNEGADASLRSPARVKGPHIYTVSAMAQGDIWASFSNWGKAIDYCAPGVDIISTFPGGNYASWYGTSFSSPHVAGLLLIGKIKDGGHVIGDPDKKPDVIAVHK
jgi:hypothetical protein